MKKAAAFLLAFCIFLSFCLPVQAEEESLSLNAQSAVLLDGDSGRILYQKNGEEVLPMASTTKIMTCIVALERGNPEDVVAVSSYAASQPQVHLGMRSGQQFYLKDLLYSLMLESHNDSAVAIAEHISGSVEDFAVLMNEKAQELSCSDTYFITPNGLDAQVTLEDGTTKIHSTTAADLAAIMRYCVWQSPKKEMFLEITGASSWQFTDVGKKSHYVCGNHNTLLSMMEGALSGKTGFTGNAGYCYVGAVEKDGKKLVAALLACGWPPHKTYKWSDVKKLINYGLTQFEIQRVGTGGILTAAVSVENGKKRYALAKAYLEEHLFLLKAGEKPEIIFQMEDTILAPVKAGEEAGQIIYCLKGETLFSIPLVVEEEIPVQDWKGRLWRLFYGFFGHCC